MDPADTVPTPNPVATTVPTLKLTIKDKQVLYTAYIGQFKGGGLFIPTARPYKLNDELHMILHLMTELEEMHVKGWVRWITPKGAHGNRSAGIGVQFEETQNGALVRNKIENYLAGMLKSEDPTHTF